VIIHSSIRISSIDEKNVSEPAGKIKILECPNWKKLLYSVEVPCIVTENK
jgi:hypothetical protein